jgi:PST family polysaccharide transporter
VRKKIKGILQHKEIQRLLKNFLSMSVVQLLQLLTPVLIVPFLITQIGFSLYGNITFIFSIIAYFFSVTDYSFKVSATRDISTNLHNSDAIKEIIKNVITIKAIMFLFSISVIGLIALVYPPISIHGAILSFGILLLAGYACSTEWYYLGIENTKQYAVIQVVTKLIFLGGCVVLVKDENDYLFYPMLLSTTTFLGNLLLLWRVLKKHKVTLLTIDQKEIKSTLRKNFPLFLNQFVPNLYNNSGVVVIGLMTSSTQVGMYDLLKKPVDLITTLISVLSKSIFPFMNRKNSSFEKYRRFMLGLSTVLFILCLFGTLPFFQFLNIPFTTRYLVTYLLLIASVYGYAIYDCYGVNYLIVRNKDKLVMKNTLIASLIAFVFVVPMVYLWGCMGAALNLLVARILMGVGLMIQKRKLNDSEN